MAYRKGSPFIVITDGATMVHVPEDDPRREGAEVRAQALLTDACRRCRQAGDAVLAHRHMQARRSAWVRASSGWAYRWHLVRERELTRRRTWRAQQLATACCRPCQGNSHMCTNMQWAVPAVQLQMAAHGPQGCLGTGSVRANTCMGGGPAIRDPPAGTVTMVLAGHTACRGGRSQEAHREGHRASAWVGCNACAN